MTIIIASIIIGISIIGSTMLICMAVACPEFWKDMYKDVKEE
jgi:hypothetical protein